MDSKRVLRIIGTLPFLMLAIYACSRAWPGGVTWKIIASAIGLLTATAFFLMALFVGKKE